MLIRSAPFFRKIAFKLSIIHSADLDPWTKFHNPELQTVWNKTRHTEREISKKLCIIVKRRMLSAVGR